MHDGTNRGNYYYFKSIASPKMMALCEKHLRIPNQDLLEIIKYCEMLPLLTELEGCDTFIDCFTEDPNVAIVVAQCSPYNTLYSHSFVGERIQRKSEPAVFRTYELGVPSKDVKAVIHMYGGAREVLIRQNVTVLKNKAGQPIGVLIVEKPLITNSISNKQENTEVIPGFSMGNIVNPYTMTKLIDNAIICFNKSGIAIFANDNARKIYQCLEYKEDIMGMSFDNLVFSNVTFEQVLQQNIIEQNNIRVGQYYLKVTYSKMSESNECIGAAIIIKDVTEHFFKEKELISKSAAIDEIHHRVKNNLQTIISLIRLQAKRSNNPEVAKFCQQTISRIYSISLTHEILSKKGTDLIELKEMLAIMAKSMKDSFQEENLYVNIRVVGSNVFVSSDQGSTVAMIVNELLQNSIKHAFPQRDLGEIVITIAQNDKTCNLLYTDDGVGFNEEATANQTLGMKLVRSLVQDKLFGKIEITSNHTGTQIEVSFMI